MAISRCVLPLLLAIALVPAGAGAGEPQKIVVKGKRDGSRIVIKGVRDPSDWFRIDSPHLTVFSDGDPDQAIEVVENLERLDFLLRLYLKPFLANRGESRKFTLYFRRQGSWLPGIGGAEPNQVGMVNSCVAATQGFSVDVGRIWKQDNAGLLKADDDFTLMHNMSLYAANFLHRHTDIRGPRWFVEGFSAFFGGVLFTDTQMRVGRDGGTSYNFLQGIDEGRAGYLSFDQVLRTRLPIKINRDITWKSNPVEFETIWEYLGRAFNLVHYMLSTAENRDKMARYLEAVNNGADPAAAFAEAFGLAGRDVDTAMWHYRRTGMKVLQVDVPELPKPFMNLTRLSRAEGGFVLDNAVLKSCPSPEDGKAVLARLKSMAAGVPAVDFAQTALSRAHIEWGDPRDALPYLERAARRDAGNPELHYLLGLAHLHLAAGGAGNKPALLAAARTSLAEAAALAPGAPEVAYALFRTELMDPEAPPEKAAALAIDAWRNGHDVPSFARAAALAHAWRGDAANAYLAFNTLARNEQDPENAAWAARWLASLEQGVAREVLLAAMRMEKPASAGFRRGSADHR